CSSAASWRAMSAPCSRVSWSRRSRRPVTSRTMTGATMTTAADAKPATLSAPIDLATIKDDLGIPADDTSNDAWLQRRIEGIWSRFQAYTGRPLQLASTWADDWGLLITNHPAYTQPPLIRAYPSATVFLRVFPVLAVSKLVLSGE